MDVVMDDPLPAPTGAAAMAKFLEPRAEGPPAAGAAAGPATAAPHGAQPSTTTAAVQPEPQRPQPQRPPPQPAQQQQQAGMSRLEFETCVAMHGILAKYKEADPFRQPVDVEGLGIPDYYDVIKKPMDLKTVREKLKANKYKSVQEWRADIQTIWDNARKYNGEGHPVTMQAAKLEAAVDRRMDDAVEIAKANMAAEAKGEPRPRKSNKPRSAELNALLSSQPGTSDSDSMDEPPAGPAARRSPEVQKVAIKRERDADAAAGRPPKRRVPAGPSATAAAAGGAPISPLNLDLDTLATMLNTPLARQLGAEEPDDLAFLALWKRYMTRKQQLVSAAADSEPLQRANQQLRGSLQEAHNTIVSLKAKMSELELARSAAVAAKAGLEQKLLEVQTEKESLQAEFTTQKEIMEAQRDLLEQQQSVLRKLAAAKQALLDKQKGEGKQPAGSSSSQGNQQQKEQQEA